MAHSTPPPPPPHPHELGSPLHIGWRAEPGVGYIDLSPVSDGVTAVVSGSTIAGLALADGSPCWRYTQSGQILDLSVCPSGPLVAHAERDRTWITALSWDGALRWQIEPGIAMASRSLCGLGTALLARGVHLSPTVRQVCRLIDAATGAIQAEYPYIGEKPDVVPRGIISSIQAGDPATTGLWLYDLAAQHPVRLHPAPHDLRVVVGALAVIDTFNLDEPAPNGEQLAIDTATGQLRWSAPGGPALTLAADDRHLVGTQALADGRFAITLRDLRSGESIWQSDPIAAPPPTLMLAADVALAFIDGRRLLIFDRAGGALIQTIDEPSTAVYGACFAAGGLVDVCGSEVRFLTAKGPR